MALLVEESSPVSPIKDAPSFKGSSPSSDRRFWSTLRCRVDTLVENRGCEYNFGGPDRRKRLKEDSLLLLRGFDSVADTLSQLHHNIDNALQGARDLAQPPTLTDLFHRKLEKREETDREGNSEERGIPETEEKEEGGNKELKRKFEDTQGPSDDDGKLGKAKKLALSMTTKAYSLSRELKSIRSDLWFMQDRCALLEEENLRLRNGLAKGIQTDEDDLVRLQLEALLAEKSRLSNENANLMRENACLNQLVEYHQITSQQLQSPTMSFYEQAVRSLDFSSPPRSPPPHMEEEEGCHDKAPVTPSTDTVGHSTTPLDEWHSAEAEQL